MTLVALPASAPPGTGFVLTYAGSTGGSIKIVRPDGSSYYRATTVGSGTVTYTPTATGAYRASLLDTRPPRKTLASTAFSVVDPTPAPVPAPVPAPTPTCTYGGLWSAPWNTAVVKAVGLGMQTIELELNRAYPASQTPDMAYVQSVIDFANQIKGAGLKYVVELGAHHVPDWVRARTEMQMQAQDGSFSGLLDVVWNDGARNVIVDYLTLFRGVISGADGIRLGAGGGVEFLYPGGGKIWSFGPAAKAVSPVPGWTPGNTTSATMWWDWYVNSLVGGAQWVASVCRSLGYGGQFWVLLPGRGSSPGIMSTQLAQGFTGNLDVLGRAAYWPVIVDRIAPLGWGGWCSSAIENGVWDTSQPGDVTLPINDATWQAMSSHRWIAMLFSRKGMAQSLENPGFGDSTAYGTDMMRGLKAQADAVHATWCVWAHEHNLADGTNGLSFALWGQTAGR